MEIAADRATLDDSSRANSCLSDSTAPPSLGVHTGRRDPATFVGSFGIAWALIGGLAGGISLWSEQGPRLFSSGTYAILAAIFLVLVAARLGRLRLRELAQDERGYALGLAALFFSDWLTRSYNIFQGPSIRGEIFLLSCAAAAIAKGRWRALVSVGAFCGALAVFVEFLSTADGRLIFSDDHATFLYRLMLLKRQFPSIPFYNPLWNGGVDARDFFASGALNLFLLAAPLIYLFPVPAIYNVLIAGVLFVLLPLSCALACRVHRLSWSASSIAALLGMSTTLLWYRWALKYGTMGFTTSTALAPVVLALAMKILDPDEKPTGTEYAFFILFFSLMILWSPAAIAAVPLVIAAIRHLPVLLKRRGVLVTLAALVMINFLWISLFWSVSKVSSFLTSEKNAVVVSRDAVDAPSNNPESPPADTAAPKAFKQKARGLSLKHTMKTLRENAISTHPLILLFFIPGIFVLPTRRRLPYVLLSIWLILLGSFLVPLKPQLELDRMLVILAVVMTAPAAAALERVLECGFSARSAPSRLNRITAALTAGTLLTGPLCASAIVADRSIEQFAFASRSIADLTDAVRSFGGDGRVLFSGFVLHEWSGGHLAPLVLFSGHPAIASSFVHDQWRYRQILPKEFAEHPEVDMIRYLDLYNVSAVVAHEPTWIQHFNDRPSLYEPVWHGERFQMYRRRNFQGSYFLEGSGDFLGQSEAGATVRLHTSNAVLKFNYFPFLRAAGCSIKPRQVAQEITFIELSSCPLETSITIESDSPFVRLGWRP